MLTRLDVSATTPEQRRKILEYAADVRKFEITLLWQRSLFFWGFIGAAFIAYANFSSSQNNNLCALIACFGLVCSVAWTLQNRGSKYWQEAWETKIKAVEYDVLGAKLFSNEEPRDEESIWGARRYSVSNLLTALSDFTAIIWTLFLLATLSPFFHFDRVGAPATIPVGALVLALLYAVVMCCSCRRRDR